MEDYKILSLVGEGSFGRVFKAKIRATKEVIALKIIRKCGRSTKELVSLRSECEIQKNLHHRNIIQMINSFETENEIVVVTEFCKRDLHYILSKQCRLTEKVALPIVCDLVSALFYLHSNRVLHRDLKPQNVLITEDSVAKLCDFGFARSMSRGTHVLTSIKGTPLYMAPELIEESPYDHNADLWSLGCIVYEMLVGTPPFKTNSILQLVRMIRYEEVKWPTHLSVNATSFLRGLLQKDPAQRLSWPTLLKHPFLQDKVSSSIASCISQPLTQELSSSQALEKETQKQDLAKKGESHDQGLPQKIKMIAETEKRSKKRDRGETRDGACQVERLGGGESSGGGGGLSAIDLQTLEQKLSSLKMSSAQMDAEVDPPSHTAANDTSDTTDESTPAVTPLETEEWLAFLEQSMKEVMRGDVESMSEKSFITMVTNALTNHGSSPQVSEHIACLLSLPFVAPGVTKSELAVIISVYKEVKVVSSLMYSVKLLTNRSNCSSPVTQVESGKLSADHLIALERVLVLVNQLVHTDELFLSQLCDVVALLHLTQRLHLLLSLHRVQPRIALDLVAILTHILRQMPENSNLVDETLLSDSSDLDWFQLMFRGTSMLQTRACLLMQLMAQYCDKALQTLWSPKLDKFIRRLEYDSCLTLRNAAEDLVEILRDLPLYNQARGEESDNEDSQ